MTNSYEHYPDDQEAEDSGVEVIFVEELTKRVDQLVALARIAGDDPNAGHNRDVLDARGDLEGFVIRNIRELIDKSSQGKPDQT